MIEGASSASLMAVTPTVTSPTPVWVCFQGRNQKHCRIFLLISKKQQAPVSLRRPCLQESVLERHCRYLPQDILVWKLEHIRVLVGVFPKPRDLWRWGVYSQNPEGWRSALLHTCMHTHQLLHTWGCFGKENCSPHLKREKETFTINVY